LEGFHQVDVRQNQPLGRQTRGGCFKDASPESLITEDRKSRGCSHIPKIADKEQEAQIEAISEDPEDP